MLASNATEQQERVLQDKHALRIHAFAADKINAQLTKKIAQADASRLAKYAKQMQIANHEELVIPVINQIPAKHNAGRQIHAETKPAITQHRNTVEELTIASRIAELALAEASGEMDNPANQTIHAIPQH